MKIDDSFNITAKISAKLSRYSESIRTGMRRIADKVSDKLEKELRRNSPKRDKSSRNRGTRAKNWAPGSYARSWGQITTVDNFSEYEKTVRNKSHYQLTHLLENGHRKRNNGFVKPRVHIEPEEKKAEWEYYHEIEQLIKNN